jgi:hypothetical protein
MIAFPAVHVQFAPLTFIDQLFFEQSSTGFVERVDAGPAEFGRQRLKPPLTAAANPAESGRWSVIRSGFSRLFAGLRRSCAYRWYEVEGASF